MSEISPSLVVKCDEFGPSIVRLIMSLEHSYVQGGMVGYFSYYNFNGVKNLSMNSRKS